MNARDHVAMRMKNTNLRAIADAYKRTAIGIRTCENFGMLSQYLLHRCPPTRIDYEPSTWRASARAVHDKQVPGNHNTCVTTFAGVVANELQKIISGRSC
ncbi:MAG: hypothetical protein WBL96_17960, partial [Pseudolabrys sp.]